MRRVLTTVTVAALVAATASIVTQNASADPPPAGTSIVLGAGLNNTGQLGLGATSAGSATPVQNKLPAGLTLTSVAAGYVHSLALTSTGTIYAWGDNTYGELGTNSSSTTPVTTPVQTTLPSLPAGVKFTQVAVGYYDSFALASDGTVWAWGYNGFGALGISLAANALVPTKVNLPAGTVATAVSAGYAHTLYLTSTGAVYASGTNNVGQLGTGGGNTTGTAKVALPAGVTASAISAGFAHSLAVTSSGIYAWGYNATGQIGNNSATNANALTPVAIALPGGATPVAVGAGNAFSVALTSTGSVFAWGDNSAGQLGNGTATGVSKVPVSVALPAGVTGTAIAAGYGHTVVTTAAGGAVAWGQNTNGQAGVGTATNVLAPTAVKLPAGSSVSLVGLSGYSLATLFVIAPVATTTTVTASANPANIGQSVTYTATVAPTDGTGTVAFTADGNPIAGCGAVALKANGSSFQATCTTGPLAAGTHPVTATYSGTNIYLASSGNLSPAQAVTAALGKVVGWGLNSTAELGTPAPAAAVSPVAAALPPGVSVVQAAVGYAHSLALSSTGTVYAWGDNQFGELGTGSTSPAGTNLPPTAVSLPDGVTPVAVSVGYYTSYVLTSSGAIYSFGLNNLGQLGIGSTANQSTPTKVNLPAGVTAVSVSAGYAHALALTSAGTVYGWGWNQSGQIGVGAATTSVNTPALALVPAAQFVTAIAAGYAHSVVLTKTGAYAWGDNQYGELGNGTTSTTATATPTAISIGSVTSVSAGYFTTSARTAAGGAVAWGLNNVGQLGDGTTTNSSTPVNVALPSGVTVSQLVSEYSNGVALATTGDVYAWGANNLGQLGNGTTTASGTPVRVALPAGTTASGIGSSAFTPSTLAIVNEADTTSSLTATAASIAQGTPVTFTATVAPNDGSGTFSFFVDGSPTPIAGCSNLPIKKIGTAWSSTCSVNGLPVGAHPVSAHYSGTPVYHASTADLSGGVTVTSTAGAAAGWGVNNTGQLGTGNTTSSRVPVAAKLPAGTQVVQVAGGYVHSLALLSDGSVRAWGQNTNGELGNGTNTDSTSPVTVQFPAGTVITAVSVGTASSLALASDGTVWAWGVNNYGQLGDGTTTDHNVPAPVNLPSGVVVTAISMGNAHALALTSTGAVYSWGHNDKGQLGVGNATDSPTPVRVNLPASVSASSVAAGLNHSVAATSNGFVYAWGDNSQGELGVGVTGSQTGTPLAVGLPNGALALSVSAGNLVSGAVSTDGRAFTWGINNVGQLGNGSTTLSNVPVQVSLPAGTVVTAMAQEWGNAVALTARGAVYAWGDNTYGQLGNGTAGGSSLPVLVSLPAGGHATAIGAGAYALDVAAIVPQIATTTTLTSSGTTTFGSPVTLTATVAPNDGGGSVAFSFQGGGAIAGCESVPVVLTAGSYTATCVSAALPVGTYGLEAAYSGDAFYLASIGDLDSQTINQAPTTTSVTATPNPTAVGDTVTLTAAVGPTDGGGTVSFASDGTAIAGCTAQTLALIAGVWKATCQTSALAAGSHTITATYSGDTSYAGSQGTLAQPLVVQIRTVLDAIDVKVLSSLGGFKIRFQATLTTAVGGTPIAGEQVTFTSSVLGLNTKCTATTDANGVASCQATVNSLLTGTYTATFAGDGLYLPSSDTAKVTL